MNEAENCIREVISSWSKPCDLVEFAIKAHGYGDSNGGFGVTYPSDLDEYQRETEKLFIPDGFVEIYGYWGPPKGYEMLVEEKQYLLVLAAFLKEAGHVEASSQILNLIASRF